MMDTTLKPTESKIHWMDDDGARAAFEAAAQRWMGMSGEKFLCRWDAGEYIELFDDPDHIGVLMVATLIPWVRP